MNIVTTDDAISVILHGREQLWSLRAKVTAPTTSIQNISFHTSFQDWRKWEVRMPGASIPGHLVAGSFWTEEGWDFLYLVEPSGFIKPKVSNVLVIETDTERYKRIIISITKTEADKVLRWWKKVKP